MEIITQKYDGQKYLYASVDDEVSWQEWDFDNIDEFIRNISEYISNRVNRTIKTVTEVSNKSFRIASYYLNEDGEWVCFEDHDSHSRCFCFIMNHLTESKEIIKVYRLSPF